MDDQLLKRIFDEDIGSHERRFQLLKLKLLLSFGLFGIGSVKIGDGDVHLYLFLILPLVPILIDFANMAESYNLRRNLAYLQEQYSEKLESFVDHIRRHRNPIYLRTNIALTGFLSGAAVLLFNLSSANRWYNVVYVATAILAALLYWHLNGRIRRQLKGRDQVAAPDHADGGHKANR